MRERATAHSQCRRYHLRLEHLLAALAVLEQVTNHGLKPEALAEHAASEQGEGWDAITACTSVSKARRSRGNATHHDLQVNKFVDNGDVLLRDEIGPELLDIVVHQVLEDGGDNFAVLQPWHGRISGNPTPTLTPHPTVGAPRTLVGVSCAPGPASGLR